MRLFIAGFVLAGATSAAAAFLGARAPPPVQPVAFSHAVHKKFEVACTDCHKLAATSEAVTLPAVSVCMGCHEDALTKSPEEAKMRAIAAAKRPLDWVRVTDVPDHVLFSHRRHVAITKIDCEECHGGIGASESPPEGPAVAPAMDAFCIACHEQRGAGVTCLACHR